MLYVIESRGARVAIFRADAIGASSGPLSLWDTYEAAETYVARMGDSSVRDTVPRDADGSAIRDGAQ